jgi:hypothetical protein
MSIKTGNAPISGAASHPAGLWAGKLEAAAWAAANAKARGVEMSIRVTGFGFSISALLPGGAIRGRLVTFEDMALRDGNAALDQIESLLGTWAPEMAST